MKIGVLANYLDTRKDLCELLDQLAREHEIVAYVRASDIQKIDALLPSISVVPIPAFTGFVKVLQLISQFGYLLFGIIPATRNNYYLTERIKLLNSAYKKCYKYCLSFLLSISKVTPHIISYDQYLDLIKLVKKPFILDTGIDVFLCFTEVSNDWIFAKIIQEKKPVWTYVYSWDHACKMKTFSKRTNYLVWNEAIQDDLIDLQHLGAETIYVWGATQLVQVEKFFQSQKNQLKDNPYNFPYLYLGCATGYDALALLEVKYCHQIAGLLKQVSPDWKLVIRPYPFQTDKDVYRSLKPLSNVIFDESISSDDKFLRIKYASAFFHFGTTMGYEAIYFDTPSFLLDIADQRKDALLHKFVHQYQNDKYLNTADSLVVKCHNELIDIFKMLASGQQKIYAIPKIRSLTPLHSLPVLAEKLNSIITHPHSNLLAI